MTFTGHSSIFIDSILSRVNNKRGILLTLDTIYGIFNRHNKFLLNSPRVFSKTGALFNSFILFFSTLEGMNFSLV